MIMGMTIGVTVTLLYKPNQMNLSKWAMKYLSS